MSQYIHKSHNVSVLLYHLVCPTKYRRAVVDERVGLVLRDICLDIEDRYEITFLEVGTDKDHGHFLIQLVPTYSPTRIAGTLKSRTAREIFWRLPGLKKRFWGGAFWRSGFFVSTVGGHGNEAVIREYVQRQGIEPEYQVLHVQQLQLFASIDHPDQPNLSA